MNQDVAPEAALLVDFVDVPTVKPRNSAARRVIESESEDEKEKVPEEEAAANRATEGEQEDAQEGPIGEEEECGPYYLRRVRRACATREDYELVNELGELTARAFVDEFIARSLASLLDHTSGLFKYIRWMALTITKQTGEIVDLTSQVEAISNTNNYELLLKEKGQWSAANRQLKEKLLKAQQAQAQAEQE
ncbi:unnamed protein product [Calypogeia fissa]